MSTPLNGTCIHHFHQDSRLAAGHLTGQPRDDDKCGSAPCAKDAQCGNRLGCGIDEGLHSPGGIALTYGSDCGIELEGVRVINPNFREDIKVVIKHGNGCANQIATGVGEGGESPTIKEWVPECLARPGGTMPTGLIAHDIGHIINHSIPRC